MLRSNLKSYWKTIYIDFNNKKGTLKEHLREIIRNELENYYIIFHPEFWIIETDKHDQGVENTKWDFSKYLDETSNEKIVDTYKYFYKNLDPYRSLINFLETNYSALDCLIDWINKINPELINFLSNPNRSLQNFLYMVNKYIDIIVYPPESNIDSPFHEIIKNIIYTKSKGKIGLKCVIENLENKGYVVKSTNSGDLLDIKDGIDLIILKPFILENKTIQVKNINEIEDFQCVYKIYCGDIQKYTVDFFAFYNSNINKIYYFFNDVDGVTPKNKYYIFRKNKTLTNDLINLEIPLENS